MTYIVIIPTILLLFGLCALSGEVTRLTTIETCSKVAVVHAAGDVVLLLGWRIIDFFPLFKFVVPFLIQFRF